MKTYNKLLIFLMIVGFAFSANAQPRVNDQRTNETKIADIVMQLPVKNTETLSLLMQELIQLDNVIPNLVSKLLPPGQGDDSQIRTAISDLSQYASQENTSGDKKKIADALCKAIQGAKSDDIKNFLLTQLQPVAGDESIATAAQYLENTRFSTAAAQVLTGVGSDNAGKTLLDAGMKIKTSSASGKVNLEKNVIEALGNMRYQPAVKYITNAASSNDLKKTALNSLAQIANPESGDLLAKMAEQSGYAPDQTGAAGAYQLFLKNSLAQGRQTAVTDATSALLKKAQSANDGLKAGIITFLAGAGDKSVMPSVSDELFRLTGSTNPQAATVAGKALPTVVTEKDIPRIAQLLNTASNKDNTTALQQAFFAAMSGQSPEKQIDLVTEQAKISNKPGLYDNVLAMIGNQKALSLIKNDSSESDFNEALNTFISNVQSSKNTPEQKLLLLRDACKIAKNPKQKTEIINQIAKTGTFLGLITAGTLLDNPNEDRQQAAVQTVITIALAHPEYYGKVVTELLNKAVQVNKSPEAASQKQAVLKHLAALPKDDGFVSMFNGKDLTGWKGLVENPIIRSQMKPDELAEKQAKADELMRRDWKVENGLLVFEGDGYDNLCSEKKYNDIEMYVDWKIAPEGDAGVYLRGSPQVQIWDTSRTEVGAQVGSGGLYNNQKYESKPLLVADNPVNEWNSFYIRMEGDKVTVYLNGQLVTDHIILENYWDRSLPIFPEDAIELQAHGTRVEYRDIYVREIPRPKAYEVSDAEKKDGFVPLFNGINLTGWVGNLKDYYAKDGTIICDPEKGGHGNLYTEKEYSDFDIRFEFKLTPAANNGLGIRAPLEGDAAYVGMELQILDNEAEVYKDLHAYQYHGSVYGVIPAKRGFLKPVGEWNYEEVVAKGNRITITLNGTVILDGDIAEASKNFTSTIDGKEHPGLSNKTGHIGFLGHGSWVAFKNLRIKELK